MELGVDGDVQVGGDRPAADGPHRGGVLARADEDPGDHGLAIGLRAGGGSHLADHGRDVIGREPVQDHPVRLAAGQPQHARPERGQVERRRVGDRPGKPEAAHREGAVVVVDPLAGQGVPEEPQRVTGPVVRLGERDVVPPADDHVG